MLGLDLWVWLKIAWWSLRMWVRLYMDQVGLGLGLTHTQANWIGWTEIGPATDQMFGSNPSARVIGLAGWTHQLISSLKHNKEIETHKQRNQNPKSMRHTKPKKNLKSKPKPRSIRLRQNQKKNQNPNQKPKFMRLKWNKKWG